MMWEVNVTDDFSLWFTSLSSKERKVVVAAVEELAVVGPTLGRLRVDRIKEGDWNRWYRMAIPRADLLYEVYLDDIRAEGLMND